MASADWCGLVRDILELIVRRLITVSDNLRFSAVCSSWRSVAVENRCYLPHQYPGLIFPGRINKSKTRRYLQPVEDDGEYKTPERVLPVPHRYYCCGSSFGWLVLIDNYFNMHLFNPLTTVKIQLPSSETLPPSQNEIFTRAFCKYYVHKAVISSDPTCPTSPQTIVFIIYGSPTKLAFSKPGDKDWTSIDSTKPKLFMDAIYYKEKFHVSYGVGGVYQVCDIVDSHGHPTLTEYALPPSDEKIHKNRYLVELKGELYLVVRTNKWDEHDTNNGEAGNESEANDNIDHNKDDDNNGDSGNENGANNDNDHNKDDVNNGASGNENETNPGSDHNKEGNIMSEEDEAYDNGYVPCGICEYDEVDEEIRRYRTMQFGLYKLREMDEIKRWEKVENIGDSAFFVGFNSSFSVAASNFKGCRANSIYFTDDDSFLCEDLPEPIRHDIGIFKLEDKSVESIYPSYSEPLRPPPFWFTPTPW